MKAPAGKRSRERGLGVCVGTYRLAGHPNSSKSKFSFMKHSDFETKNSANSQKLIWMEKMSALRVLKDIS